MWKMDLRTWVALLALGGLVAASPSHAADGRAADQILADLKAAELPTFDADKRDDSEAVTKYLADRSRAIRRRMALILEMHRLHPDHAEVPDLMLERWQMLRMGSPNRQPSAELLREIDEVAKSTKNKELRLNAAFFKGAVAIQPGGTAVPPEVEAFIRLAPGDERGARLLYLVADANEGNAKVQRELYQRLSHDFSETPFGGMAKGTLKQLDSLGKPFELEFTDAIKGAPVSIKGLHGKVVVIDFWATWCGPCVADMPRMKALYEEYHDQGVEFIGVSLDQPKDEGGLEKLKAFVMKNEIRWPQYYQGNGWESEFSSGWGINAIPALFVVNPEGKLHSVSARGELETMIPALLKKSEPKKVGGED